eukprot:7404462-Prorocentrum_lima.AAC.1
MGRNVVATTLWGATPRSCGRFAAPRRHNADHLQVGRLQSCPLQHCVAALALQWASGAGSC